MAILILSNLDHTAGVGIGTTFDVVGTNSAEIVHVARDGKATFDGSFSRGNDTIVIDGRAADYSIRQTDVNHVAITNSTGGNLIIPVGTGVNVKFSDIPDGRILSFGSDDGVRLGTQVITATDTPVHSPVTSSTGQNSVTIELSGSGSVNVQTGDGNDVIYTDNSAGKARWVFNSLDDVTHAASDLHSQPRLIVNTSSGAGDLTTGINNIRLTVSFEDITSSVFVSGYTGPNATGSVVSSTTSTGIRSLTDLQINQAVKSAINNDPVLSKLLVAREGPSGTLIVQALVDGLHTNTDLSLSLTSTALTAGQTGRLLTAGEISNIGFDPVTGLALGGLGNAVNASLDPSTYIGATNDDDRWYSDFARSTNGEPLTGSNSVNANLNVVEGGAGNDLIVLSSTSMVMPDTGSTETIDIDGIFSAAGGRDTILNFGSAATVVSSGGSAEQQLIAVNPAAAGATATTSPGTIAFDISRTGTSDLTIAPISFGPGTTLVALANAVAGAINTAPDNAGAVTATVVGDDVALQYNSVTNVGNIPQSSIALTSTDSGTAEANTIVISAPPSGTVNEGTAKLTFGGVSYNAIIIAPGEAIDSVGARLAATVTGNATATFNVVTDTITVTSTNPGPITNNADVVFASGPDGAGDPLVDMFGTETAGIASASTGVVVVSTTPVAGTNPGTRLSGGYDIFDVTTIIGAVETFVNDAPQNGAEPDGALYNEAARIEFATRSHANVTITDTVSLGDYTTYSAALPVATANTLELTLIQNIARAADNAATPLSEIGAVPVIKSIVITVDTENVGHFYLITNGAAAGDATAEHLGNIELAQYDAAAKAAIGDWDAMTIQNFSPLTAATALNTFVFA